MSLLLLPLAAAGIVTLTLLLAAAERRAGTPATVVDLPELVTTEECNVEAPTIDNERLCCVVTNDSAGGDAGWAAPMLLVLSIEVVPGVELLLTWDNFSSSDCGSGGRSNTLADDELTPLNRSEPRFSGIRSTAGGCSVGSILVSSSSTSSLPLDCDELLPVAPEPVEAGRSLEADTDGASFWSIFASASRSLEGVFDCPTLPGAPFEARDVVSTIEAEEASFRSREGSLSCSLRTESDELSRPVKSVAD